MKAFEKPLRGLVEHRAMGDIGDERLQLQFGRQLAVENQIGYLEKRALLG